MLCVNIQNNVRSEQREKQRDFLLSYFLQKVVAIGMVSLGGPHAYRGGWEGDANRKNSKAPKLNSHDRGWDTDRHELAKQLFTHVNSFEFYIISLQSCCNALNTNNRQQNDRISGHDAKSRARIRFIFFKRSDCLHVV